MDPVTATAIITATMQLAGLVVEQFPKVVEFMRHIGEKGEPVTIDDLNAAVQHCHDLNDRIQKA